MKLQASHMGKLEMVPPLTFDWWNKVVFGGKKKLMPGRVGKPVILRASRFEWLKG